MARTRAARGARAIPSHLVTLARARASAVQRADLWLLAILAVASAVRVLQLSQPARLYFDEFYAQDACVYLGLPQAVCGQAVEVSWMHPPLGKWLISTGIAVFGFDPIGWRVAAAATGIALAAVAYVLCLRLTGSREGAIVAGGLVALDPLAIEMSRIAMLDVFTAATGAAAILFLVIDGQTHRRSSTRRLRLRPWRLAAGTAAGAAVAIKWSGIFVIGVAILLAIAYDLNRSRPGRSATYRQVAGSIASACTYLLAVPALVYVLSYAGRIDGDLLTLPWADGAWLRNFVVRQSDMVTFHLGLQTTHPSASPAWSWFLAKRPVVLLHETVGSGVLREILALVNPLVWLPALGASVAAAALVIKRRAFVGAELVVSLTVLGTYVPWLVLASDRVQVFAYYALPTIPFLAVAIGWAISRMPVRVRRVGAATLAVACVSVFLFWLPLIYGWPMSPDDQRTRILFSDCGQPSEVLPQSGGTSIQGTGWCWR